MGSRTLIQFPIFSPPTPPHNHRPLTEVRFSRWNNANAEKFIRHERAQKEIEDQIRFHKRFDSALNIANNYNPAPPSPTTFKSTGTPSSPSSPSIPGKKSKYSRIYRNPNPNHPAFKSLVKTGEKTVVDDENGVNDEFPEEKSKCSRTLPKKNPYTNPIHPAFRSLVRPRKIPEGTLKTEEKSVLDIKVDENGVNYEFPEAPFTYQYSYTETPKVKPKKLREPLVSPFGPESMLRPWTGRKPLPPSKKKLPEFDSFKLPPPHKKGVKPVQAPGPFLKGSGPKYVRSRDEVLGEPLTKEEIMELINSCKKTPRQMNIGRDGLTHNMLENIHAHWKRRRVCKIKCKGVCTVDMKNVCDKLEEKTGGKIIYNKGGLIYLFRGRNYNYKTRPRFPLMLWRPVTPVYPRLVKRVPEGLTLEEATEMRKKGRDLIPICKLAKNGVYCDLVKNVREALEACELVRINCQGLNPSDYRKIGAKLKDLVPCVLVSFEQEHILMWRGRDWVSFLAEDEAQPERSNGSKADIVASTSLCEEVSEMGPSSGDESEDHSSELSNEVPFDLCAATTPEMGPTSEDVSKSDSSSLLRLTPPWMEVILQLRNHAIESGSAVILDDSSLDSDIVYKTALTLSKSAPLGPVFQHRPKKVVVQRREEEETGDLKTEGIKETPTSSGKEAVVSDRKVYTRKSSSTKKLKGIREDYLNVVPKGSLGIDELAKLLA